MYTVSVNKKVVFKAETVWECIEYADFYYPNGYTINKI